MEDRKAKGRDILARLLGSPAGEETRPSHKAFSELTSDYLFGEVWSRPGLEVSERSLVTVAVLCATGKEPQLRFHLKGALNVGHSPDKLREVMIHVAHYSGWPNGVNGLRVLGEVVEEQGLSFSEG